MGGMGQMGGGMGGMGMGGQQQNPMGGFNTMQNMNQNMGAFGTGMGGMGGGMQGMGM